MSVRAASLVPIPWPRRHRMQAGTPAALSPDLVLLDIEAFSALGRQLLERPIGQGAKMNWCWVACIDMARAQQELPDRTADEIAKTYLLCNPLCDQPCDPFEVEGVFEVNELQHALGTQERVSLASIIQQIKDSGNTVALGWKSGNLRHMVLAVGYPADEKSVIVFDPRGSGEIYRAEEMREGEGLAGLRSQGVSWILEWVWLDLRKA